MSKEFIFKMLCMLTVFVAVMVGKVNVIAMNLSTDKTGDFCKNTTETNSNINQSLTELILINLKSNVLGQQFDDFLSDYDNYSLKFVYHQCCNVKFFVFNGYLVDKDKLFQELINDPRVVWATLERDKFNHPFYPRILEITFIENTTEENIADFMSKYSEYRFRGWQHSSHLFNTPYYFTFDYNLIFAEDFINIIKDEDIIQKVTFDLGWYSGIMPISFNNEVKDENKAAEYLMEKYIEYDIEIKRNLDWWGDEWIILFDYYTVNEFLLLEKINQELIASAYFHLIQHVYCDNLHLSINNINVSPDLRVSVYPNPVRNGYVSFLVPNDMSQNKDLATTVISIYNVRGQLVKKSNDFQTKDRINEFAWNAKDANDQNVPSGIYFYQIKAGSDISIGKFLILK